MSTVGFWPVAAVPVGKIACATALWRSRGRLNTTVVVKVRFRINPNAMMTLTLPEPVRPQLGELAPYLGQADVVVTRAHAHAPAGSGAVTSSAVRLALYRNWPVIDKSLLAYGVGAGGDQPPTPFTKVPLVTTRCGTATGVLVNPHDPSTVVGIGPIDDKAPERIELLGGQQPPSPRKGVLELSDRFPWSYYQVAPPDQRTSFFRGDEWLVLEGMDAREGRLQSQLPCASAQARVYPPGIATAHGPWFGVAMQADRLSIDVDGGNVSILWRGSFPVADEATARALAVVATVGLPSAPAAWPTEHELYASPVLRARGLVPKIEEEPPDSDDMLQTAVRQAPLFDGDATTPLPPQMNLGPVEEAPVSRRLALNASGEVSVEIDDDDMGRTVEWQGSQVSLLGSVVTEAPSVEGAPPPRSSSAPDVPPRTAAELRQELSDALSVSGEHDQLMWTLTD